ncbi:MAG: LPXTG cell wall anchor domain-containing protein, partial [Candidatus Uhrbacteria bacterium]|nr:LPXTG cell wall anchor domain-containing protein [Candidatus Uhrbacteria bacterium]
KDSPEDGIAEESAFTKVVAKKGETTSVNLQTITQNDTLAKPITQDLGSDSPTAITLSRSGNEEATLNIPSGAVTSSSSQSGEGDGSSAMITVSPLKAQAVATKADYPIKGISIEASQGGTPITSLSGIASGEISYKESDLPVGIKESDLEVKAFNENSGQWEKVSVSSVDTDSNVLTFATTHFTDFAIVSAAPSVAAAAAAASSTVTEAILPATGKDKDNSSLSLLLGGVGILLASGLIIGFRRKKSRI